MRDVEGPGRLSLHMAGGEAMDWERGMSRVDGRHDNMGRGLLWDYMCGSLAMMSYAYSACFCWVSACFSCIL